MRAGQMVTMEFSDGTSGPVPVKDIAAYQQKATEAGGWARVKGTGLGPMGNVTMPVLARGVSDWFPSGGAIVGSITGGVLGTGAAAGAGPAAPAVAPYTAATGRVAGGVAGGALGKAAQEAVYRATGAYDAPGTVGGEAAAQSILGPVGEGAALIPGAVGRALVGSSIMAKGKEGVRAIEEMIRTKTPVGGMNIGRMMESGGVKAKRLFEQALANRDRVNMQAGAQGVTIPRQSVLDAIQSLINKGSAEMADESELRYLNGRLASWTRRKAADIAPSEVQSVVTRFDSKSKPIYAALNAKGQSPPSTAMQAKAAYMKKVADTLRELLHSSVPGHEETSKALGRSIAMKDAVLAAEALPSAGRFMARTGVGTALGGVAGAAMDSGDRWRGGRLGGAVGAAAMNAPQVTSRLGIAMADPALAALLQQTPRFVLRSKDENQ